MKLIKMMGASACLALVVTALVGVSSALAHTVVETCMSGQTGCAQSSKNTKFKAHANEVQLKGLITNKCESNIEGEILVALAEGTTELDAHITKAEFFKCNFTTLIGPGLPWLLTTTDKLFKENLTFLVSSGVHVIIHVPLIGECLFSEDATHMVGGKWTNGSPSVVSLSGSLTGPCGDGSITGGYSVTSVTDPGLASANNIVILHKP